MLKKRKLEQNESLTEEPIKKVIKKEAKKTITTLPKEKTQNVLTQKKTPSDQANKLIPNTRNSSNFKNKKVDEPKSSAEKFTNFVEFMMDKIQIQTQRTVFRKMLLIFLRSQVIICMLQ